MYVREWKWSDDPHVIGLWTDYSWIVKKTLTIIKLNKNWWKRSAHHQTLPWSYPDYQATEGPISNPLMMWLPQDTNMCPKDLKRTTGETIVVPRTYPDNMYIPYEPSRITERSEQLDRYFDQRVPRILTLVIIFATWYTPLWWFAMCWTHAHYSMMIPKQPEIRKGVSAGST